MAKIPKFCPDCGHELGGQGVCEKCGFDTKTKNETNKMSSKKSSGSNSTWDTLEPIVSVVGKWAWLYGVVVGVIYIIISLAVTLRLALIASDAWNTCNIYFPGLCGSKNFGFGTMVWQIITAAVSIGVSIMWVRPKFSVPCGEKDWETLLTNVVKLGNIQIPWMLIMGVLLEIFGYGWGGAVVLICALLIIFLGPRKYEWKTTQ